MGTSPVVREVHGAVRAALAGRRVVLAVSGGRDSMVLLHAAATVARSSVACVATFDHGTGPAARAAVSRVARQATRLGFPVVIGHVRSGVRASEAAWREERHRFLGDVAGALSADVATAHSRDDQLETVLMRVLRDTGPRGLAALHAPRHGYLRPLLDLPRASITEYARVEHVRFANDPANESPRFLRNRVRHDLLPALRAADPTIEPALLELARRATGWRRGVDALAARLVRTTSADGIAVDAPTLTVLPAGSLAILWPALVASLGVAMDWRGTERAARFTITARPGARMPLSGGWEIVRSHDEFVMQRAGKHQPLPPSVLTPGTHVDGWRFLATRRPGPVSNPWVARLPEHPSLTVRSWQPGDRMRLDGGLRKVKRFLTDARISGTRRGQWPVVLAGDEIVWIPGVRRGDAAALPVRPGRPGVWYRCELDDR